MTSFTKQDFETPDSFLSFLRRLPEGPVPSKIINAITNEDRFSSDAWYDMVFDVGQKDECLSFISQLKDWHQHRSIPLSCVPDILEMASSQHPWIENALNLTQFAPAIHAEHQSYAVHSMDELGR